MNTALGTCVAVAIALGVFRWEDVACIPFTVSSLVQPEPEHLVALQEYRLSGDVWPTHYDIEIRPYFSAEPNKPLFTFDGAATITVTALRDGVTSIGLHQLHLDILSWSVLRKSNSLAVRRANEKYDEKTEILTLLLGEPLLRNVEYLLVFNYAGVMEDNQRGFYRSYFNTSGRQVWMGSTQFQQTHARRAFPCFDEPKFKTTFTLKINHNLEYGVYSNTPIVSSVDLGNNRSITTFGITPKMSSYLLAFIVAPFELSGEGKVMVLTRPQAANQTEYGILEGSKLLAHLGDWLDYPFDDVPEITRMYMAAVPDMASGAMENWGLVIFRESSLLYVPEDATTRQQQAIATIISHELAHQWFGNLVTCEWWDVTWLNEGFAAYVEWFGTAVVEPGWELDQQFVVERMQSTLQMDSCNCTHPMTSPFVSTPSEAKEVFDAISYNKAASVLRMMEHFLSSDIFKTALREYVKKHAFEAIRPVDFFAALNHHNADAQAYMEPWTTQAGFPLVTVTATNEGFTLTQKRFFTNGTDHDDRTLWPLPVTYATRPEEFFNTTPTFVATQSHTVSVANASSVQYFILNNQQIGFYRVNYEASLWSKIRQALRSKDFGGIHVLNRAQIVDDLFNLAKADVVGYGTALDILDYLKEETEYLPWLAASNGLQSLSYLIHQQDEMLFTHHILDIFGKAYEHVKFRTPTSSERRVDTYLREVVLGWICRHGHTHCGQSAVKEFERFRANPSVKVHPDLRPVVYCEGVRHGSDAQFNFLLELYHTTNVVIEKQRALQGLCCVSKEHLITKFMSFLHSPEVQAGDRRIGLSLVLNNAYAIAPTTAYIVQNSAQLLKLHDGPVYLLLAFYNILSCSKNPAVRETIREFGETHPDELDEMGLDHIDELLAVFDSNRQITLNHRGEIGKFLRQKASASGTAPRAIFSMTVTVGFALLTVCRW